MTIHRKRRGRGEGSVYQHSDGRWIGIVSTGYSSDGKRRRRFVSAATKKEAQEALREAQNESPEALSAGISRLRVSEYLSRWLATVAKVQVRATTFDNYQRIVRLYVEPNIGGLLLTKLSALNVEAMLTKMQTDGKSANLRRLAFVVTSQAMKKAVRWRLLRFNPCDAVDAPQVARKEMTVVTPDHVAAMLRHAENDRLEALYVLAIASGMRLGELFGLQWSSVDLDAGIVNVAHTLAEISGHLTLAEPKSRQSRRRIDIPAMAVEALAEHRKRMVREGHAASSYVFVDSHGGPLRRSHFHSQSFRPLLERAKLPSTIRFHDLRHAHATMLLSDGVPVKTVQDRLGHAKGGFTLDVYSHALPGAQKEAADRVASILDRAKGPKPKRRKPKTA